MPDDTRAILERQYTRANGKRWKKTEVNKHALRKKYIF